MEQTASSPSFANTASVTEVTGSLATTSLLAGGTLGTAASLSRILNQSTMTSDSYQILRHNLK